LIELWKDSYLVTVGYSGSNPRNLIQSQNVNYIDLTSLFASDINYTVVVIISAHIPEFSQIDNSKLFDVNVSLIEKVTLKFPHSKIIFCSTVSVYTPSAAVISEKTLVCPLNEYGLSKFWAEKIIQRNSKSFVIFRISSLIGENMKSNSFIPKIIDKALKDRKIVILGNGERLQNYIDVRDLSMMIEKSLNISNNEILLGVSEKSYSNIQIAKIVKRYTGCEIIFENNDDSISCIYDASYTRTILSFNSHLNIEKSIEDLILWKTK
jgi:UDP-glucose 4-epimerase